LFELGIANPWAYRPNGLARALPVPMVAESRMLKISIIERHTQRRLVVEGKLAGPWVAELNDACEKATVNLRGRQLVLDMKHLTAISHEGENVLLELMSNGIKLRGRGVFTKHILKQLSRRINGNGRPRETKQPKTKPLPTDTLATE
jgi:hypothetical protein